MAVGVGYLHAQISFAGVQYFQPGYAYRHALNPAFVPQWGYVGFPVVGSINVGLTSNLGIADFVYTLADGEKVSFMHPDVSPERFLDNIKKDNYLNMNADVSVLSAGWFWGRSFWTFDVRLKQGMQMTAPYELFEFVKKEELKNPTQYNMKNLGMEVLAYTEIGIGCARELDDRWTVGGKFKFLIGVSSVSFRVRDMQLSLIDETWKVSSDADLHVFGRFFDVERSEEDGFSCRYGKFSPSGYGMAVDLGAEFRPRFIKGLRFSASLLDLGFLCYKKENVHKYEARGEVEYTPSETLAEDVHGMFDFAEVPVYEDYVKRVMPTLNLAVEYGFFGNRFSVGLLSSTTFYALRAESELSVVGNIHPARWFSVSLAYAFIGNRRGLGWAVNFTPKYGLNLFISSNYTPCYVNSDFVPLKRAHMNAQVGLTFAIGNNRRCTFGAPEHDNNAFPYTYRHPERNKPNRYETFGTTGTDEEVWEDPWGDFEEVKTVPERVPEDGSEEVRAVGQETEAIPAVEDVPEEETEETRSDENE